MAGMIHDAAARSFAIGFYGGLGEHESIQAAFEQGRAAIHLDGLPHAERPKLKVRDGFDAARLILAGITPSALAEVPCPYPGMRPYTADDAGSFHANETSFSRAFRRAFGLSPTDLRASVDRHGIVRTSAGDPLAWLRQLGMAPEARDEPDGPEA